jgi:predicted RecA/RadA family phage recombinase
MATNFVQNDDVLSAVVPYATVTAGQGILVGALFGVSEVSGVSGDTVSIVTEGVFDITKEPALAITAGARVFWDGTNRRITTTTTANYQVGIATAAALAADATVRVALIRCPPVAT